jgi:DNA-directed RNA polymerase subunit RPC12/RpoP
LSTQLTILLSLIISILWFRMAYRCPTCGANLGRPVTKQSPPFSPAQCPCCGVRLR